MSWTDERVSTLKTLWLDGLSASQVAKTLGGVTRLAVIGKLHRLGLSGRVMAAKPSRQAPMCPAKPAPIRASATDPGRSDPTNGLNIQKGPTLASIRVASNGTRTYSMPAQGPERVDTRPEKPGGATVLTIGAHMCRWPIGDPSSEGFTFCGKRQEVGRPYCSDHTARAYSRPLEDGKKRRSLESLANIDRPRRRASGSANTRVMFE